MRFLFIASIALAIDWYTFQAVWFLLDGTSEGFRMIVTVAFWSVPVITLTYLWAVMHGLTANWPSSIKVLIRTFALIFYLSKLLLAAVILVDDLRRLFVWTLEATDIISESYSERSRTMSQIGIGLGALPLILLTYGIVRNAHRYKVYTATVPITGLVEPLQGLRIVQISDIHAGSFLLNEPVARSVEMINALKPDLVFFTGDLVNSNADEADPFVGVFSKIRARYGIYSILGNHDYGDYQQWPSQTAKQDNFEKLIHQHKRMGWHLLRNENVVIEVNGCKIGVIGIENYSAHTRFSKYGDMTVSVKGMPPTDLRLLLSHDPSHWSHEVVTHYPDVDLTLSGHTHGFQFGIEIPGLIKWSPAQYIYKQWAGLYQNGRQFLYVNRGLGFLGYPGRVGILPEITLLTLTAASRQEQVL